MSDQEDYTEHYIEMWKAGWPDGNCSCLSPGLRPEGGFQGVSFEEIGSILGRHLDAVLK
jgi:hypothetical protein